MKSSLKVFPRDIGLARGEAYKGKPIKRAGASVAASRALSYRAPRREKDR